MNTKHDIVKIYKPTWLYIKRHTKTGLLYFGKTCLKDPVKYLGSGTYWKKHLKVHGSEFVETIWLELFEDKESLTEFAIFFSEFNDIVNSEKWANFIMEDGLGGGASITPTQCIYCDKICTSLLDLTQYHKENCLKNPAGISEARIKNTKSRSDHMKKQRGADVVIKCEFCDDEIIENMYKKYHGINCIENPIQSEKAKERILHAENKKLAEDESYQRYSINRKLERELKPDLVCEFCNVVYPATNSNNFFQHHGINCRKNPNVSEKILENNKNRAEAAIKFNSSLPDTECKHCGFIGSGMNMKKYHHDNCRKNPNYIKENRTNINLNGTVKSVTDEKLQEYLNLGWIIGTGKVSTIAGKISINKDGTVMYIEKTNLRQYINEGWSKGTKSSVSTCDVLPI